MENNQHSNSENAAARNLEATSFSNRQPGQQLPGEKNRGDLDKASAHPEEHSESSKPEKDNETLGTP